MTIVTIALRQSEAADGRTRLIEEVFTALNRSRTGNLNADEMRPFANQTGASIRAVGYSSLLIYALISALICFNNEPAACVLTSLVAINP